MDEKDIKTAGIALLADPVFCKRTEELIGNMKSRLGYDFPVDPLPRHISLRQSFPFNGDLGALEEYLKKFFAALSPIKMKTKKIQVFLPKGGQKALVWVRIRGSLRLRLLHYRLLIGLRTRFGVRMLGYDGLPWVFHSTILYDITDGQTARDLKDRFDNMPYKTDICPACAVVFYCAGDAENPTEYCMGKLLPLKQPKD